MKIRSGILTMGMIAAGLVSASTPAVADTKSWTCVSVYGGEACFRQYGDDISVTDTVADGYRAEAHWVVSYSRPTPDCVDRNGADNGREICYFNMWDGGDEEIAFSVVLYSGDRPVRGSDQVRMPI